MNARMIHVTDLTYSPVSRDCRISTFSHRLIRADKSILMCFEFWLPFACEGRIASLVRTFRIWEIVSLQCLRDWGSRKTQNGKCCKNPRRFIYLTDSFVNFHKTNRRTNFFFLPDFEKEVRQISIVYYFTFMMNFYRVIFINFSWSRFYTTSLKNNSREPRLIRIEILV